MESCLCLGLQVQNNTVQQYRANTAIHIVQSCTAKCFIQSPELYNRVPSVDELGTVAQAGEIEKSKVRTVPDGILEKCLEPGIQGTSQGNSGVWRLSQALSALSLHQSNRRDPVAMEETCANSISCSFGT
jgi:hypothetical protein